MSGETDASEMEDLLNALSAKVTGILGVSERGDLVAATAEAAGVIGLHGFMIGLDKDHPRDFMFSPDITTSLESDIEEYLGLGLVAKDPLLRHVRDGRPAFSWDTASMAAGADASKDYVEYLRWKTIRGGVTVPLAPGSDKYTAITFLAGSDFHRSVEGAVPLATIIGATAISKAAQLGAAPSVVHSSRDALARLSGWQTEILSWIAAGKSNAEIAIILGISKGRVDYQVSQVLKVLNVATRIQAATIYSTR